MEYLLQNQNWKFHLGEAEEAWRMDYDDALWQDVELPHDWSVEYPFSREYSSGTGYVKGGTGWYRHGFQMPEQYRGKKISLVFDGIYKNSTIWVNGSCMGGWPYGYTTFFIDITEIVRFGEPNQVSVKVDQREISDSRWFTGAGITRKVGLLIQEEVHTEPDGVFFSTVTADAQKAEYFVQWEVENCENRPQDIEIRSTLTDESGETVSAIIQQMHIEAGETKICRKVTEANELKLWSDENPVLYTLVTEIKTKEKDWYLTDIRKVGIRTVHFDSTEGMRVNGIPKKLNGICLHHDGGCLGAAVTKEVWRRRLSKLKAAGCNAVRMSHNPHMPELYDLCDEMGFYVMDEAFDEWENAKNKWHQGHNVYPPKHEGYYQYFHDWHKKDLHAMIRRDRSHACVIMWSVGNELDYPNDPYCHPLFQTMTGNNDANKPAAERQYNPGKPNAERLPKILSMLLREVKEEDDTRPATVAVAFPELTTQIGFIDELDVVGYNYKEQLYQEDHERFPEKTFLGSETDHSMEAYEAAQRPYICGQFLWTGVDYMGEALGWPMRGSDAGLLNLAGYEKPAYYRREALWTKEACAKLLVRRSGNYAREMDGFGENWSYNLEEETEVRCYTNRNHIRLFLNGKDIGEPEVRVKEFCGWTLPFEPGVLTAVYEDGSEASKLETAEPACRLRMAEWKDEKSGKEEILQIEIRAEDREGRFAEGTSELITIQVEGGVLKGIENGDLFDVTEYTSHSRRLYKGRMILYVKREKEAGRLIVRAMGDYVGANTLEIE